MLEQDKIEINDLNVLIILDKLNDTNYSAYLIGGAVRDTLMGNKPHDYDIATDATPEEVMKVFKDTVYDIIPTGIDFGTVTLHHTFDKKDYQLTTFRNDGKYVKDGRKPEAVTYSNSLLEDVKRRDFTINSIAYSELTGIVDIYNGQSDIDKGIIRTVGEPSERFYEDPLRILRAIRFAFRYNFTIESDTLRAMINLAGQQDNTNSVLNKVSKERIHDELIQILSYKVENRDLYESVWPILNNVLKFYRGDKLALSDKFLILDDYKLKLIYLYADCNYAIYQLEQKLRKLKFTNADIKYIIHGIKFLRDFHKLIFNDFTTVEGICFFLKESIYKYDDESLVHKCLDYLLDLDYVSFKKTLYNVFNEPIFMSQLAITGNDIMHEFDIMGKLIGEYLDYALEFIWRNPDKNNKEDLIQLLYNINKE